MASFDLLSLQPHRVSRDLTGYITYIYGAAKTGKTTLATQAGNALLFAFERGYNALPGVMVQDVTSWGEMKQIVRGQASLSITNSQSILKLMSIESVIPSNHLILCHPLLLPSVFPSIRAFSNESVLCIRWPKYWSFSFRISPSNEYSVLISFRVDWLDLLAVQGTLKSPLQHRSSKAPILRGSAFFTVQFSHPYMTTGKTGA